MNAARMPAGTKASIVQAVLAEKYPKQALGAIAARFGITYQELRVVIDNAGYPDTSRMRAAVLRLDEEERHAQHAADAADIADAAVQAVQQDLRDKHTVAVDAAAAEHREQDTQDDDPGPEEGRLTRVAPSQLSPDPENPRDPVRLDDVETIELADSIAEIGLLQPIVARRAGAKLYVVAGHRRLAAVLRLKWSSVPVIVRGPMPPDEVIAAMLIENGQRKDLDPIEEARGLAKLKAIHDCTDAEVARKVGRTQVHVSGRLQLLNLSAEDQAAIRRGEMKLTEAVHKGRLTSGRVGRTGVDRNWHLGPNHELAQAAKARCLRLGHSRGRTVGGMACGECWESVIRADARRDFVAVAAKTGTCPVCDNPVEKHDHHAQAVGA